LARKFGLEPKIAGLVPRVEGCAALGWNAGFIAGAWDVMPVTMEYEECESFTCGTCKEVGRTLIFY